jgi:O-antigen/teichoic acid export membrane protein
VTKNLKFLSSITLRLNVILSIAKMSLDKSGHQRLDLGCASAATVVNVGLNFLLIPRYGLAGAALATLVSEGVWITAAVYSSSRLAPVPTLLMQLARPLAAGAVMAICFIVAADLPWQFQPLIAGIAYLATLLALGDKEIRSWMPKLST